MKDVVASTNELRSVPISEKTAFSCEDSGNTRYLTYKPLFCQKDEDPYSTVKWGKRDARILNGEIVAFEQKGVEAPITWSDSAVNIVAQKYFRGELGTKNRENSVKQIIERVTETIKKWALAQAYFNKETDDVNWWINDLKWLLLHQHGSFNSPVWFNLGVHEEEQQTSACFCQSVQDSMESIAQLQVNETLIFKGGSGTGTNFSTLRSSKEKVRGGGTASGPVSFMRGYDAWAGIIRSGGKVRRSAKLAVLNIDHPDIIPFIHSKTKEEKKVKALIETGYNANYSDENGAYSSAHFQSTNHSVRIPDSFMEKLISPLAKEEIWDLKAVTDKNTTLETISVLDLWNELCEAAHCCGDPGVQFDTTINKWNTCKETARLNTSNPCGEYHGVDETSCNLASLNLCKFEFNTDEEWKRFGAAVEVFITAQDVLIDMSSYPTPQIGMNTRDYRALGLGYTNLGAYLISNWIPYDSEEGRKIATNVTSYLTATSYLISSTIAQVKGPFNKYERNRESMLRVIALHETEAYEYDSFPDLWTAVYERGFEYGFRNSQVTLLAPTGTISFMMDCDTTGVEPDLALSKVKILADGGVIAIDNRVVEEGLRKSGEFSEDQIKDILDHIRMNPSNIKKTPHLNAYNLKVLETAIGDNAISSDGHLDMLMRIQPFLSGAISKTVNVPESATPQDIGKIYQHAWKAGIKNITVYRDKSKNHQPLQVNGSKSSRKNGKQLIWGVRKPIPNTRDSVTKKFEINGAEGYLTVGLHDDGTPGELFIKGIEGTLLSGLLDSFAISTSLALQYGCPLEKIVDKFIGRSFEPHGWTSDFGYAKSIVDYIAKWMRARFLIKQNSATKNQQEAAKTEYHLCACGGRLIPGGGNGSCFTCQNCGESNGACG